MIPQRSRSKLWLTIGGAMVVLLAAAVFTLGSLNPPFTLQGPTLVLFALSYFIVAALLVFGLILVRSLVRLWTERRSEQLGSRFKTRMVLGAMGISLLPVVFMFLFSYGLMNRTLSKWFPRPLEIATQQSSTLLADTLKVEAASLSQMAGETARRGRPLKLLSGQREPGADAAWILRPTNEVSDAVKFAGGEGSRRGGASNGQTPFAPRPTRRMANGVEIWQAGDVYYLTGRAPFADGSLVLARRLPEAFVARLQEIETQALAYGRSSTEIRSYRTWTLTALGLFTLLLLFSLSWVALFLSKQVTVPVQALAEATREISQGNFDYRVTVQARDELGTLVNSFNQMARQLGEGRRQIDEFTRHLQQAVEEIEHRRKLMETILENIPTGVLSVDTGGGIRSVNPAAARMLGRDSQQAHTLAELMGNEAARSLLGLMRKSLRMGAASGEIEISGRGGLLRAAVTVSALGPRRANPGYIVVIDDLTELLRAQKAAAWQEVAQRIAHEIKNPLTPIQLSAQRLMKHLERTGLGDGSSADLAKLVGECAELIEREVNTLKALVDEFSQFARFPAARLAASDLNDIVTSALQVFNGRLEEIAVHCELAAGNPQVKADPELLRRVVANLIDNAAEAMEGAARRELRVSTSLDNRGDAVEISVADSGHGISSEDKEKLFLPHFSTKGRGTGLGLAIASRIVAEHHGTLRVEDNQPVGARFVIRLPLLEVAAEYSSPE